MSRDHVPDLRSSRHRRPSAAPSVCATVIAVAVWFLGGAWLDIRDGQWGPAAVATLVAIVAWWIVVGIALLLRRVDRSDLGRRIGLTVLVAGIGIAQVAFSVQIRTWYGRGSWTRAPRNKVFAASWLASEMWVDPRLLLAGVTTLILAAGGFFLYPRFARGRTATALAPSRRTAPARTTRGPL